MYRPVHFDRLSLWLKVGFAVAFVLAYGVGNSSAGQLQVGPSPVPSGGYAGNFYNNETNDVGNPGTLDVYHTAASGDNLQLPTTSGTKDGFLLLLGIPNDTSGGMFFSSNPITSGNGNLAAKDYFNGTWNSSGYAGLFTSSSSDAYTVANLATNGGASENWSNWSTWDAHVGVTATNFGIYVFEIDSTLDGSSNKSASVTFTTGSLPLGTFVIAYGVVDPSAKLKGNNVYDTPFTQAGIDTTGTPNGGGGGGGGGGGATPAPPSVVLLGFGGLGLAFILARSRRRLAAAI